MPRRKPASRTPRNALPSSKADLAQYRRIFAVIPDIVYKIDTQGRFTYVSESVSDLGYAPEELLGKHFSEIIHPQDVGTVSRQAVLDKYQGKATGDTDAPKLFDERRTGKRGTRSLVIRLVPKLLKDHPAASADEKSSFYGEVIAFGDYLTRMTRPDSASSSSRVSGVVYGEVSANGQYRTHKGKRTEEFDGSVGIIRNVTDRVLLEQQKSQLEQELQGFLKMEAIGQLAGGMAHDLNNVLGNVLGYAELIRKTNQDADGRPTNAELTRRVDAIITAANNGAGLLRSLLDFGRKASSETQVVDLHELITDMLQLLTFTLPRSIKVTSELSGPIARVSVDPNQIQSVLINIALNARDAMPSGGTLAVRTGYARLAAPMDLPAGQKSRAGEYVLVSISDTGSGMDEAVRSRIFEPFYTTKPVGKGTGLGLANVLRIMGRHGGFVDVKSQPGEGTTFDLCLPAVSEQDRAQQKKPAADGAVRSTARVLAIDDDPSVLDIVRIALQNIGCRVTICTDAADAVEAYRKHAGDFDLVLVDMLMPETNGFECLRKLREINPDVRAILVTGLSEEISPARVKEKGFVASVRKPFDLRQLAVTVAAAAAEPGGA